MDPRISSQFPCTGENSTDYWKYTDQELLEEICKSGCLDDRGLSSDSTVYSFAGLVRLGEGCPPLEEFMSQTTTAESIHIYGPELVARSTDAHLR